MTRSPNGLIMFNGHSQGDFLQLDLQDGFIHFGFNLGNPQNKSASVSIRYDPLEYCSYLYFIYICIYY